MKLGKNVNLFFVALPPGAMDMSSYCANNGLRNKNDFSIAHEESNNWVTVVQRSVEK